MSGSQAIRTMDLNGDIGESFGAWKIGEDEALLGEISSANIACGFHAGDPSVMKRTVRLCIEKGVSIGAHPGLPDLQGFGRRELRITAEEAYDLTMYQAGALLAFVRSEGGTLSHVKPHGALYNMAATDRSLADAIAEAVYRLDSSLVLYGLAESELIHAARARGLRTASEAFADRVYVLDGTLAPRSSEGSVITEPQAAAEQALRIAREGRVLAATGETIRMTADTLCVHGDSPHALAVTRRVRELLSAAGVQIRSFHAE